MTAGRWVTLVVVLLVVLVATMLTIQNLGRTSDLSLDLFFSAWHLNQPLPLPYLLWAAFGGGLLLGGGWGILSRSGAQRRVRELEQELARASLKRADDDWT